jgi:ABC-type antimicrobial peptide transport system permease subunit
VPFGGGSPEIKTVRFLVRASGDPIAVAGELRRDIASAGTGTIVSSASTIEQIIAIAGQEILVGTAPLVPLIATGLLLTAAGIYGVLAFAITRRAKELAVRVAMGATGGDLVRLVAGHSVLLVTIGTACGVGGTYVLARALRAAGGAGSMFDPTWPAFVAPAVVVILVGALASWIPSRRALEVNPATLLRST